MKNKIKSPAIDKNGYPKPKQVQCFKCQQWFYLKFSVPKQDYSLKNNWGYYTGKEEHKDKYKCNSCLRKFYFDKKTYWTTIPNLRKREVLAYYVGKRLI